MPYRPWLNSAEKPPVAMTTATVMEVIPPSSWLTLMAMGVVTDLGMREAVMVSSRPKRRQRAMTLITEAQEPIKQPATTGSKCRFSCLICP